MKYTREGQKPSRKNYYTKLPLFLGTEQIKRRVAKDFAGQTIFFISPEDLILNKLMWYKKSESTRQLEDIESIIKIQKKLD